MPRRKKRPEEPDLISSLGGSIMRGDDTDQELDRQAEQARRLEDRQRKEELEDMGSSVMGRDPFDDGEE